MPVVDENDCVIEGLDQIDPSSMLREIAAGPGKIKYAIVVTCSENGETIYHSSDTDGAYAAFILQRMLHKIYSGEFT